MRMGGVCMRIAYESMCQKVQSPFFSVDIGMGLL